MVDPHFAEDEQLEKLKEWWKRNGAAIVWGTALGVGVVVGITAWKYYVEQQAEKASALYEQILAQREDEKLDAANALGDKLLENYASTTYAGKAALVLARVKFDQDDRAGATAHLQWALENVTDVATQHTARLRLAYLLLDEGKLDEAQQYLELEDTGGFESQYDELKGDLYVAAGQPEQARLSYQQALDALPDGSGHRAMLGMKLDDVNTEQ